VCICHRCRAFSVGYTCTYRYVHIWRSHLYEGIRAYVCAKYIHSCIAGETYIHTRTRTYTRLHTYTHIDTYAHTHTHTYIHSYTRTHTYTYIHTYMHRCFRTAFSSKFGKPAARLVPSKSNKFPYEEREEETFFYKTLVCRVPSLDKPVCMYMYVCMCVCVYVYVYVSYQLYTGMYAEDACKHTKMCVWTILILLSFHKTLHAT
jgi:hypothetical protein